MIVIDNQDEDTFKAIHALTTHEEFIQIGLTKISSCLKHYFPMLIQQPSKIINIKDQKFYTQVKKLLQSHHNITNIIIIDEQKNKTQTIDLQKRKNTRATLAMRNSKNREQLKKDQIFVRLIPRTHNCIHFMVKNNNFPRIQCRLSCNQHLQYLLNYLSNKWLRGKVGVGYQIKLYPDPSTYMQKYSGQGKRPAIIHEPLNNYLMFTDIMAAFGVAQNGCINLLYDITELRKQKSQRLAEHEFEPSSQNYTIKLHQAQNSIFDNIHLPASQHQLNQISLFSKQKEYINMNLSSPSKIKRQKLTKQLKMRTNQHQIQDNKGFEEKNQENFKVSGEEIIREGDRDKQSQREKERYMEREKQKEKQRRGFGAENSLGFSQVNSMGYQMNPFNSNHILGTIFNMNNSNTFLNLYTERDKVQQAASETPSKLQNKAPPKQSTSLYENQKQGSNNPASNSQSSSLLNPVIVTGPNPMNSKQSQKGITLNQNPSLTLAPTVSQNKLQNIRNFINIIEKEAGAGNSNQKYVDIGQKQQNSLHKSESNFNFKKQVKTVTIIKKKNVNQ